MYGSFWAMPKALERAGHQSTIEYLQTEMPEILPMGNSFPQLGDLRHFISAFDLCVRLAFADVVCGLGKAFGSTWRRENSNRMLSATRLFPETCGSNSRSYMVHSGRCQKPWSELDMSSYLGRFSQWGTRSLKEDLLFRAGSLRSDVVCGLGRLFGSTWT